jgi:integrase/recombinase XerD
LETGLRISELLALTRADAHLAAGPHVRATGKGRKARVVPLTRQTVAVLRVWTRENDVPATRPLFPARHGGPLTRDAIERRLAKHVDAARHDCPSLRTKRLSMHVLRHTTAMPLLGAGIDTSTIALWLGHEQERTTHVCLHADLAVKQRTLDRIMPARAMATTRRA